MCSSNFLLLSKYISPHAPILLFTPFNQELRDQIEVIWMSELTKGKHDLYLAKTANLLLGTIEQVLMVKYIIKF